VPSRRSFLTGAAAAALLAGCTSDGPADRDLEAPAEGTGTEPVRDPDLEAAAAALAAVEAQLALLESMTRGRARRRRALAGTEAVHRAHQRLLAEAVPEETAEATPSPGPVWVGSDREAFRVLASAEHRLGRTTRRLALEARSGPFARVLAGIAAASAQQSVLLRGRA
jgi:hypothetical protein